MRHHLLVVLAFMAALLPLPAAQAAGSVPSDFNGDGFADLAIGAPFESLEATGASAAGAVNVLYGGARGLTAARNQFWHQDSPGVADKAAEDEHFGQALATTDFNGDGFADLAVGVPGQALGGKWSCCEGAVHVLYGSRAGLTAAGNKVWHQNSPGVLDAAETADSFGSALAAGDFNADGYGDLAVGVPGESVGKAYGAGAVQILFGSRTGPTAAGNQIWHQNSPGVPGAAWDERFGAALAAGRFDRDRYVDLAVGAPEETVRGQSRAGVVHVLRGAAGGLTATGSQLWSSNSPGVPGTAEAGDRFGAALAAANFGGGARTDLAIGAPEEDVGTLRDAGAVTVLPGSKGGLTAAGASMWTQDTPGMADQAESGAKDQYGYTGDLFGYALAAADLGRSGHADLAIGVPGEDIERAGARDAGAVAVVHGSASGLDVAGNGVWSQASPGVADQPELFDQFGAMLTVGRFGSAEHAKLAVAVPNDDVGTGINQGAVHVLHGTSAGMTVKRSQYWTQDSPGVADRAEGFESFGSAMNQPGA